MAASQNTPSIINAEPPEGFTGQLSVGEPKTSAAGLPAVASSMKHVFTRTGPLAGTRALLNLNQKGGFDCPSCAWPDPDDHRSSFEFCENGAKALASETTAARVTPEFFAEHSLEQLRTWTDYDLDLAGRLTHPMVLEPGEAHYRPITWDEAFALVAYELHRLSSPHRAIFYTSGRASNEAAFLYQLFARDFGTNNLPDCSNMCHESSGVALKNTIGVGKGTVTLGDLEQAEVIIVAGQNPGTNHPRMLSTLQTAAKNGAHIVSVNPLQEAGLSGFMHPQHVTGTLGIATPLAKEFLAVRPNGDMALFRGLAKAVIEKGQVDHVFIAEHTQDFEKYQDEVRATSWEKITALSGLDRATIEALAVRLTPRTKLITCWAMGLTQHHNAVASIQEIAHLHLLIGAVGRPGAGLCPVRGHSNVQGDRTVGIYEKMPESFLAALDQTFGINSPRDHGYDTVAAIQSMHATAGQVFIALGGNFLQASPDTNFTAVALQNCALTVQISTKLNRSHLLPGRRALILPCLGRSEIDRRHAAGEQFVTVENSMSVVHLSRGVLEPASPHLRSETQIVAGIAAATQHGRSSVDYPALAENYDLIRDRIEAVIPGFSQYNQRVRQPGGFYLPNAARERRWETTTKKANFVAEELTAFQVAPGQLILQTLRSHDQFNTTIYGLNDRYRGIGHERRILFVNPQDMKDRGLSPLQTVAINSHWQGQARTAQPFKVIPYDMPAGACAAYFPEASALVPIDSIADHSHTPTSKAVAVTLAAI